MIFWSIFSIVLGPVCAFPASKTFYIKFDENAMSKTGLSSNTVPIN